MNFCGHYNDYILIDKCITFSCKLCHHCNNSQNGKKKKLILISVDAYLLNCHKANVLTHILIFTELGVGNALMGGIFVLMYDELCIHLNWKIAPRIIDRFFKLLQYL